MNQNNVHVPVLLGRVVEVIGENLESRDLWVFDGTLGGGGYSRKFLELGWTVRGSDLDRSVVEELNGRFEDEKFEAKQGNFSEVIQEWGEGKFDVVVVDLGYSSNQLEASRRGFSYQKLGEGLDLRYDVTRGEAAWELIGKLGEKELAGLIYRYSGESISTRVARELKAREIRTVGDAVEAVEVALPAKLYKKRNAILSRVWQSLRIAVNQEFENLELFLERSLGALKPGGLLMVVDFHSLEDKIVAKWMREMAKPVSEDMYGNRTYAYEILTKKGLPPRAGEIEENVRARSALLRVLRKK